MSLLTTGSIYLRRVDLLEDNHEGVYPLGFIEGLLDYKEFRTKKPKAILNILLMFQEYMGKSVYINCWSKDPTEQHLMWKNFCPDRQGVLIETTVGDLKKTLSSTNKEIYISEVVYFNDNEPLRTQSNFLNDPLIPFIHKRNYFQGENEVRCIFVENKKNPDDGVYISININDLVKTIYICPTAPSYFSDMIKDLTKKYGYNFDIRPSLMAKPRNLDLEKELV